MSNSQPARTSTFFYAVRKFFVSGFVVFSFVAYALHQRFGGSASGTSAVTPTRPAVATAPPATPTAPGTVAQIAAGSAQAAQAQQPSAAPTAAPPAPTVAPAPTPAAIANGYKDGEYSGQVVDAYYGNVQVKAVVQGGKIADVQFLEWPNDRRTSVRINNVAMPYLISEAIQAQNARVDVISGATLTSEAFAQSLQSALESAMARS